jgi:outer membrane autotransporter protein
MVSLKASPSMGVTMVEIVFKARVRGRIRAVGLGITISAIVVVQFGHAQNVGPGPTPGITTLPGTNTAQQTMAQSINTFCPTVSTIAATPNQIDLKTICSAMIGNALQLQGRPIPVGMGSYGLDANGLTSALQSLNGGAELLVPTSQASVVQTTQTSRQTGAIETRLKELRNWTTGTVVASTETPRAGQVAALGTPEPRGQFLIAQNQAAPFGYSIGPLGVFVNGLGQFGSRDLTTSENGYSFNNAGFIAGADYRITPQLIAGVAFGYTRSNTNFDTSSVSASGQSLNGNLLQGNLYATYFPTDDFYLNGIAIVGGGNNDSRRHIVIPSRDLTSTPPVDRLATGSFGDRVAGFTLAGGYALPFGSLVLTPIARFLYQHTGVDAFGEEAAMGANLQYGSSSVNTVLTFLGADAQYTLNTSLGAIYPIARFHWAHQYSPANTSVSVAYSNDTTSTVLSSFILPGTPTSRNYFDLGIGVTLQLSGNSSGFINYDSILGLNHTTYNSFTAGVRLTF